MDWLNFNSESKCSYCIYNNMEVILNNPGFQQIAENVFLNLNYEKLETCRLVNVFCKDILDNPMFWLKKFIRRGLSKKNQIDGWQLFKLHHIGIWKQVF